MIAGNLSLTHGDMHTNVMEACITATAPGQVNHILDAAEIQHQCIQSWTTYLNTATIQEQQKILTNLATSDKYFSKNYLRIQEEDNKKSIGSQESKLL